MSGRAAGLHRPGQGHKYTSGGASKHLSGILFFMMHYCRPYLERPGQKR